MVTNKYEPFENADKANAAIREFFKGVAELRRKLGIEQVLLGVQIQVVYEDQIGIAQTFTTLGRQSEDLPLAAYVYGALDEDHRKTINLLRAGGEAAKRAGNRKPIGELFNGEG